MRDAFTNHQPQIPSQFKFLLACLNPTFYPPIIMSAEILIVLGILAATIILFTTTRLSPDIVAILVVVALLLTRILSINDALAGMRGAWWR